VTNTTQQNLLAEILPTPSREIKTDRFIQAVSSKASCGAEPVVGCMGSVSANARCGGGCSSGGSCKSAV